MFVVLGRGSAHAVLTEQASSINASSAAAVTVDAGPRCFPVAGIALRVALSEAGRSYAAVRGMQRHLSALRPLIGAAYLPAAHPIKLPPQAVTLALSTASTNAACYSRESGGASGGWGLAVPNMMQLWLPLPTRVHFCHHAPQLADTVQDSGGSGAMAAPAVITVELKPKCAARWAARSLLVGCRVRTKAWDEALAETSAEEGAALSALPSAPTGVCHSVHVVNAPAGDGAGVKFNVSRFAMTQVHKQSRKRSRGSAGSAGTSSEPISAYYPPDLFAIVPDRDRGGGGNGGGNVGGDGCGGCFTCGEGLMRSSDGCGWGHFRDCDCEGRLATALGALMGSPENNLQVTRLLGNVFRRLRTYH